jgi:hypothetical protein
MLKRSLGIILPALLLVCWPAAANALAKMSAQDYVNTYAELAIREMKRTGVPASITLAQGLHESANGNSTLATQANNHFGIKCHNDWTGEKTYRDDDAKNECFRKYDKAADSFVDHSNFLRTRDRYAFLFELKTTDYKSWAHGLKKAGYATNPQYASIIIKLIEDYELNRFDEEIDAAEITVDDDFDGKTTARRKGNDNFVIHLHQSHAVKYNNGVRFIEIKGSDTFEGVSREFGLKDWELYSYNDLASNANIKKYSYLYIQAKRNRAHPDCQVHVLKQGETLHYLSQKYGVKMRRLLKYNNLKSENDAKVGDSINLRKRRK